MTAPNYTLLHKRSGVWVEPNYLAALLVNFGRNTKVLVAYESASPVVIVRMP